MCTCNCRTRGYILAMVKAKILHAASGAETHLAFCKGLSELLRNSKELNNHLPKPLPIQEGLGLVKICKDEGWRCYNGVPSATICDEEQINTESRVIVDLTMEKEMESLQRHTPLAEVPLDQGCLDIFHQVIKDNMNLFRKSIASKQFLDALNKGQILNYSEEVVRVTREAIKSFEYIDAATMEGARHGFRLFLAHLNKAGHTLENCKDKSIGEEQPHSIPSSISKSLFDSDIGRTHSNLSFSSGAIAIQPVSTLAAKEGSLVLNSTQSSPNLELFSDGVNATQSFPIDDQDALQKPLLTATPAPSKQAVSAPFDECKKGLNANCSNEPPLNHTARALNIHALPFQPSIPVLKQGKSIKELKELTMETEQKANSGGLQQGKSLKELKALAFHKEAVQTKSVTTKPLGLLDLKLIYEHSPQISLIDMSFGMNGEDHKRQKDGGVEVSELAHDKIELPVNDEDSYTLEAEMELDAIHLLDDFNPKGGLVWFLDLRRIAVIFWF
ncbi:unnamed protein product [Cuscuta campestris]|uniref:Uncharacterized protein n=1 Tax=Cuscuta campestris TaxID=132261 RepID=A0A484MN65_9ASTE|nr:unnamed protein product [Cuscuta campestris]